MRLSLISFSFICLLQLNYCAVFVTQTWKPPRERESMEEVRVFLGGANNKPIKIQGQGLLQVYDVNDLLIKKAIDILQINPGALKAKIQVKPESGFFVYDGIKYRGTVVLEPQKDDIYIINMIPLEKYLYSVVPSEVPSSWPEEALKAQAVTARTYVVREMLNRASQPFDVNKTTASQVYSGMDKETPRTTKAVEDTKGTIILHEGNPIQAFFHSNAGGYTEKPENVWGSSLPYLDHVESVYDRQAPNYAWEFRIASVQMNRYLVKLGIGYIEDIKVVSRNISKRVDVLEVKGEKGTVNVKGVDFRKLLGDTKLKSLMFDVRKESNSFHVKGYGFGHGVGMSQWGAFGMAKNSHNYPKIVQHFYPGTQLAKIVE